MSTDPRCPLCQHPFVTTSHVLACNSDYAQRYQTEALNRLEYALINLKTQPDLIIIILEATRNPINLTFISTTQKTHQVTEDQGSIGWSLVQLGFVA